MNETINREDLYLFQTGKARQAYLTFGCHYQKDSQIYCLGSKCKVSQCRR